jgi:hypothetical protein
VTGLWVLRVSSTNKTDSLDITEILLKVALNTMNLTLSSTYKGGGTLLLFVSTSVTVIILYIVEVCDLKEGYFQQYFSHIVEFSLRQQTLIVVDENPIMIKVKVLKLPKKLKYFGCGLKHPQLYQSMTMYN